MPVNRHLKISVRHLVEFVLHEGDLHPAGFMRPDRAVAGTRGHQRVQKARPEGYEAEVSITHVVEEPNLTVEIIGRIDGIFSQQQPITIDEIKTTTLPLAQIEADHNPLHWAQAKCYAYFYAWQQQQSVIQVQLTYYQLDSQTSKEFVQTFSLAQLTTFFADLLAPYVQWANTVLDWRETRNQTAEALEFPYVDYRAGQRDMAVAVYRTVRDHGKLFAQAPTGIGKTIATLFPAVKAIGLGLADKIFYLTAKTPGRLVAQQTLDDMRSAGLQFKSVTLTAKDKVCFCTQAGLDPAQCEFTQNYYGKIKAALADLYQHQDLTRVRIEETAQQHQVCPFELSLDVAVWADCIICDYNYAFDPKVYLRRFFDHSNESYIFLVDEAHNLPDRARAMFSAELTKGTVLELQRTLGRRQPEIVQRLGKINQILLEIRKTTQAAGQKTQVEQEVSKPLLKALRKFRQAAEAWLILNQPSTYQEALLDFYFQTLAYLRVADGFNSCYVSYFERLGKSDLKAKLYCIDPAPLLTEALARSQATIFFSATLLPLDYFDRVLLGSTNQPRLLLTSPFPTENMKLLIHQRIATKYVQRADSYRPIAETIAAVWASQPGNYLVFFPSYAYLTAVYEVMAALFPDQSILVQERGMTEENREAFLAQFSDDESAAVLGFAVMGGIFGEGIDLVGQRLIGAIIVGVGLPQLGLEKDLIKEYFAQQNGRGFEYAYQYPGLNRVMQAAGRVIRTEQDRGVIILIDERFTHSRYTRLFPPEWRTFRRIQGSDEIQTVLEEFWAKDF